MRRVIWLMSALLLWPIASVNADGVGSVTLVIGAPQLETESGRVTLEKGDTLAIGARILTEDGDHVHIRFADGTLVSVRPNTMLSIDSFAGNAEQVESFRVTLDEGSVRTISGEGLKTHRERFRLNTPIAAIGIRGTDFTTQTDLARTQVSVHAGEVVMAPFGESCLPDSLGPCSSPAALSLAAGTNEYLQMRAGGLPERFQSTVDPASLPGDPSSQETPRESDPEDVSTQASRERADAELNNVKERPELRPFDDTEDDLKDQTGPLIWGHWFAKARGDDWSIPAVELLQRYQPTVSSGYYGLFRDPAEAGIINPLQNEMVLELTAADATLDYQFFETPAKVTSGYLLFDFEARAFSSELTVDTDRLGTVGLNGIGFISPTGVFVSRSNSDRMAGAMTSDGSQAGMLFEKRIDGGRIQGVTLWSD